MDCGLNVAVNPAMTVWRTEGGVFGQAAVGEIEKEALSLAQSDQRHVDASVGQRAVGDRDIPGAVQMASQQLTADGVAHVVGEEAQPVHTELVDEGHGDVGLQGEIVSRSGLSDSP